MRWGGGGVKRRVFFVSPEKRRHKAGKKKKHICLTDPMQNGLLCTPNASRLHPFNNKQEQESFNKAGPPTCVKPACRRMNTLRHPAASHVALAYGNIRRRRLCHAPANFHPSLPACGMGCGTCGTGCGSCGAAFGCAWPRLKCASRAQTPQVHPGLTELASDPRLPG